MREKQRKEAIRRIEGFKLVDNIKTDFLNGKLSCSEKIVFGLSHVAERATFGMLLWLTKDEKKLVKDFEEEHDGLVYHMTKRRTTEGDLYTLLYVSKEEDEWELDREAMIECRQVCYTYPAFYPIDAEIGLCSFVNKHGCLINV